MMRTILTPEQIRKHLDESMERSVERYHAEQHKELIERYRKRQQEQTAAEPSEKKELVLTTS
jgi:hypothetical protein